MKSLHYDAAVHFERCNLVLGIPVVALSALVGTTIFVTIQSVPSLGLKIAAGLLSVCSAILASLQTFLRYGERAERHRIAGAQYGLLKSEIEKLEALLPSDSTILEKELSAFVARWGETRNASPTIPTSLIKSVQRQQKDELAELAELAIPESQRIKPGRREASFQGIIRQPDNSL